MSGYRYLVRVIESTYWCAECRDDHEDSHLECPICHEVITPGVVGPSGFRELVPGRTDYLLNGEPISEERAREWVEQMRQARG